MSHSISMKVPSATAAAAIAPQSPSPQLLRPLGAFERYSLTRTLCGERLFISFAAHHPSRSPSALLFHLQSRIAFLLSRLPLLSCQVANHKTNRPYFSPPSTPVDVSSILSVRQLPKDQLNLDFILPQQLQEASLDVSHAPLWSVTVYMAGEDQDEEQEVIAGLRMHHCISDGMGSSHLFSALLQTQEPGDELLGEKVDPNPPQGSSSPSPSPQSTKPRTSQLPPTMESILPTKPTLSYLLPILWSQILVPLLPSRRFRSKLSPKPVWPATKPLAFKPSDRMARCKVLRFNSSSSGMGKDDDEDFLKKLKKISQAHGVRTIHSTLQGAAFVALWNILGAEEREKGTRVGASTPMSVRKVEEDGRVTGMTGNYVADFEWQTKLKSNSSFWGLTRDYVKDLNSLATRQKGLYQIGMLSYIPQARSEVYPTSWEKFFMSQMDSPSPYRASVGLWNLGLMKLESGKGWRERGWCQTPSSVGNAFTVDICGTQEDGESGLTICVSWRDGVVDGEGFARALERTVRRVVGEGVGEGETVEEVGRVVREELEREEELQQASVLYS